MRVLSVKMLSQVISAGFSERNVADCHAITQLRTLLHCTATPASCWQYWRNQIDHSDDNIEWSSRHLDWL